jgi:ABC-type branched-subunit amino acid transport system substrate-binding protein
MGNCVAQALGPDSANEIVLGMSTVLTGPAENLGKQMQTGVWVGLERSNRAGGVRGRKFRLIVLDDGYEPSRTVPNVRQLIEKDDVLAIIGDVGTPTATVAIPIANEQKTLFFASFSGGGILRKNPPDRYVINFRASYAEETARMIDALVEGAGLKPEEIAFFTQRDSYGNAGLTREAIVDALEKLGQFDIGLGEPLNLSPNEHQASHRIWPTILKDGGFVPFQWDDIGHLLKNEAQP